MPPFVHEMADPFWHEMATRLGCTVAEAQARLSWAEHITWRAYRAYRLQLKEHLGKQGKMLLDW